MTPVLMHVKALAKALLPTWARFLGSHKLGNMRSMI